MSWNDRYKERLIGKRFGLLTVLKFDSVAKGNKTVWLCKCECGNQKAVRNDCLISGSTKSCGCLSKRRHDNNPNWKGYKEIGASFWQNIMFGATKTRKLDFNISMEYAWSIYEKQNKKCALTGLPIRFQLKRGDYNATASLDRIDSSAGYIEGNIQWVHKRINTMKWDLSQSEFVKFCKLVAKHADEV